jgi:hypothetical protein
MKRADNSARANCRLILKAFAELARVDLVAMYTSKFRMSGGAGKLCLGLLVLCSTTLSVTRVWAEELPPQQDDATGKTEVSAAISSADAGMFLPFTISPRTDSQRGIVRAIGGLDSARDRAQFEAVADVTIFGPLAVRVGAQYGQQRDSFRPSVGLRLQALSQERQGIDLGFGAFYKPEGFTEAEGEIEVMVMVARRFGRLGTFANVVYGQDPEGKERDGELRLGGLYALTSPLQVGLEARLRFDLGQENEQLRRKEGGAEFDVLVGPTASYALGPVALIGHAGLSIYGTEPARAGLVALLGLAGAL